MRAWLLALLVLPLAGCAEEEGPPLAKPTSATRLPPVPTVPTAVKPPRVFDPNDSGYVMTTPWSVGDGWDYVSNGTPQEYRTVRVAEARQVGNATHYRVEETYGRSGNRASARSTQWVENLTWTVLNATDTTGTRIDYTPGKPLRFFRNASYEYAERGVDRVTGRPLDHDYLIFSFHEPARVVVPLTWGNVAAAYTVHDVFVDNATRPVRVHRYAHDDFANEVRYRIGDVQWTLAAARVDGKDYGILQPT